MKDIGLAGASFSGRSTLFTALTRTGAAGGQSNQAVVAVPDQRLDVLTEMEHSKKTVGAQVRFIDIPGGTGSARGLAELRTVDALAIVLRCFGPDADPADQLSAISAELILADLAVMETAVEGARKRMKTQKAASEELLVFERAQQALSDETLLRDVSFDAQECKLLKSNAPLTLKPWVLIANLEEGTSIPAGLPDTTIGVYASIEAETAEMEPDEARALLEEFGVEEPGLETVIGGCYRALDLITFLTTGEDETRAWEVRRGAACPEAAGVIHTDLQRGFIRADVIGYDDLVAAGSMEAAKAAGKIRVEGKEYVVQEGDILHVRFAV